MSSGLKPTARKKDIVTQEADNEILVYDLKTQKAHCLNQISAAIWMKCDGRTSVETMVADLSNEIRAKISDEVVLLALNQLSKAKLLDNFDETQTGFGGLSRRETVKRIGLGAAAALPVITSLVAPYAVQAQSPGPSPLCAPPGGQQPPGCPCTNNGDCFLGAMCPTSGPMVCA